MVHLHYMKRPLPIGISDFKKLIDAGCLYVDKTLLVKELIERNTEIALVPRMRRFGKTLNLSMLRYFFEKTEHDTSYLFRDLQIWQHEKYRAEQGQYPVIFLSFKGEKYDSWEAMFSSIQRRIAAEFKRHKYLLEESFLCKEDEVLFNLILAAKSDKTLLASSLELLSLWLYQYHKKEVIILIDEYDTPAHAGGNILIISSMFILDPLHVNKKDV